MTLSLGQNISSLKVQRELAKGVDTQSRVFERLSSGQRINRASDDAAGASIALTLGSDVRVYSRSILNIADGVSATSIADAALSELGAVVTRIQSLAEQAANGTLGRTQRLALDQEGKELVKEYNRIIATTSFNGVSLFNPSTSEGSIQAGYGTAEMLSLAILVRWSVA
jgi:flagellin